MAFNNSSPSLFFGLKTATHSVLVLEYYKIALHFKSTIALEFSTFLPHIKDMTNILANFASLSCIFRKFKQADHLK